MSHYFLDIQYMLRMQLATWNGCPFHFYILSIITKITVCPGSSYPCSNLLQKMGHYFLDIQQLNVDHIQVQGSLSLSLPNFLNIYLLYVQEVVTRFIYLVTYYLKWVTPSKLLHKFGQTSLTHSKEKAKAPLTTVKLTVRGVFRGGAQGHYPFHFFLGKSPPPQIFWKNAPRKTLSVLEIGYKEGILVKMSPIFQIFPQIFTWESFRPPNQTILLGLTVEADNHDCTMCPKSSDPIYVVTYYIKWVTTSWTDGKTSDNS